MSPPLCNALPCWVPNQRVQNANSLTPPERMLKKKRAVQQVHWMPSPMLVQVKRRKPLGTHPGCPLPRGATEGIAPCKGSIPGHVENFEGLGISILVSPLFRETTKEDAISYRDWCSEIEDTLQRGHNAAKVKEAMFASLEGMARDNAKMINENGDLHITHILDRLDFLYGVSITFQSLNAALCGLQQKPMESARAYYNCMAQITVILRECHSNRYRPGELARMSKDCFYAGLLPKNRPMVVHLKDQPHTTPLDLLRALLEQEENDALTRTWYPPSTSARLTHPLKLVERYHRHPPADKRNDGYTVRPAQLDTAPAEVVPEIDPPPLGDTVDALETWYNDGFLIGLHQATEIGEHRSGRCFNCQKEGHHWCQCKEILSPELQELSDRQDREREERKKKALNPQGDVGMKGGHAPTPLVGISPALPQVPNTPAQ